MDEPCSQYFEEEQDLFLDDDPIDSEDDEVVDQVDLHKPISSDQGASFRKLLAGPSMNKAGLGNVDKEKINQIIYEASKGSAFFEREKKRDQAVTKRIDAILAKYEAIKEQDLTFERNIVDNMISDLEETRDLSQCICHIDMDAFYASVEELENPELKKVPMAVGGMSMLCTSNYLARQYGVRSAMPGFIALKLCPELQIVPLHFPKYRIASAKVRDVFRKYDPHFLPMSLDEAYLNLTEYLKKTDLTPSELVQQIRQEIFDSTQLTASAGIACNRTLSKVCSDINKPNGQYYLPINRASIVDFVKTMRVRQIPGVGRVTERVLEALGVVTCGDVYHHRAILYKLLSPVSFQFMLKSYLGISSTTLLSDSERKSISVERTFSSISDPDQLFAKLKELSELLEKDLEKANMMGRNLNIKLKSVTYEVRIRSKSFPSPIWTATDIYRFAKQLLIKELPVNIRLMGIRVSTLKQRGSEDRSVMTYFSKLPPSTPLVPHVSSDNQTTIVQKEEIPSLECPICHRQLVLDNLEFNKHVDECLSKMEVKEILKSQRDYFHEKPTKRIKKSYPSQQGKSLFDYYSSKK
ncbi:hypothetical protein BD560DRAFT_389366 [Blakeslea trispora]|nr:hypothetical protein BD560DRAFT_389366 [Blakeslea trispora]